MSTAAPPLSGSAARQRTSTLRRSCEACRVVKAKCVIESNETAGQSRCCKRCMSHGLNCVFENALARPKKLKYTARTRVKDVEDKLDGLIALISARKVTAAQGVIATPELSQPAAVPDPLASLLETPVMTPKSGLPLFQQPYFYPPPAKTTFSFDGSQTGITAQPPPISTVPVSPPSTNDVVDRDIISEDLAQRLLSEYTINTEQQFPFVLLPPFVAVGHMRRERPFVLLAVLTVGAEASLQTRLALEFRKGLAQAMIVDSKNSLDLLQGLLIFCTWHHLYFKPFSSQLYQLSQIAVTMAVDLNLSHSLSLFQADLVPRKQDMDFHPLTASRRNAVMEYHDDVERARTFIGTYCMSSSVAVAHRKPTHFKFDDRVDQISQLLANSKEVPSDTLLLLHHVSVRKLTEDIYRIFNLHNPNEATVMDERYIDAMVKDFERQYAYIRDTMSSEAWDNASLKCAVTYLPVVIYEVGLRVPPGHRSAAQSSSSSPCCSWCTSSTRLAIVMKCIHAAQNFITTFLDLPNPVFRQSTIVEVSRHIDAVFLLARAGLGVDTMNLQTGNMAAGRGSLLATADLERHLEASERKMASMVVFTMPADGAVGCEKNQNAFWKLREIYRFCLAWYRMHVREKQDGPTQIRPIDEDSLQMSPMSLLSKGPDQPDLQNNDSHHPPSYCPVEDCAEDNTPEARLNKDAEGMLLELNVCERSMAMMSAPCHNADSGVTTRSTSLSDSASLSETATGSGSGTDSAVTVPGSESAFGGGFDMTPIIFESTPDIDPWSSMMQASPPSPWFTL